MAVPTFDEIDSLPALELCEWLETMSIGIACRHDLTYLRRTLKRELYLGQIAVVPDDILHD